MPVATRIDPVLSHNFLISFVDSSSILTEIPAGITTQPAAGFSECTGLELTMPPEEYKEGGRNGCVLKFPNRVTWSNLILKRGITADPSLWQWHYAFVQGRGQRRDGMIVLQDDERSPIRIWHFRRGLPVKWTGPALHGSQNSVAIETLEIAHEGLQLDQ